VHNEIEGSEANERQQWVYAPWDGDGHTIDFGHMIDGGYWGIDDAFVDYTQARVEVSDSPTWSGASHKEIQIPLSWSPTSIEVRLNRGSFDAVGGKYLYVVEESGAVNERGFLLAP
jgi:hypothetical protein